MLFRKFLKYVADNDLMRQGEHIIIAASGGVDSMVLAHLLLRLSHKWNLHLSIAHVNFRLRGKSSDLDEALVKKTADQYSLPYDVLKKKPAAKENLQDAARNLRYNFFASVAAKRGVTTIATAHHLDDQAETILLHLIRGTGLKGLAGIKPKSVTKHLTLIRPLLFAKRDEIEEYAKENKIKFRSDKTNITQKYTRNAVRLHLLPILKKYNPEVSSHLARLAKIVADEDVALDTVAKAAFEEAVDKCDENSIIVHGKDIINLPVAIRYRIFRLAFEKLCGHTKDLNFDQVFRMDEILLGPKHQASYRLPAPWKFLREGELICIRRSSTNCDR